MLTADEIDALTFTITELYEEFADSVVVDIARRIGKMGKATATAGLQAQRLNDSALLMQTITAKLSRLTFFSEVELRRMFREVGVKTATFDDKIYRAAGLDPLPLNLSPSAQRILLAGLRKTDWTLKNLTNSTAKASEALYFKATDLAYMQVSSGAMSYTQAIRSAVMTCADEGMTVVLFGGRKDHLDVAIRRALITGVSQTSGELQMARAGEMGQDLIQVSEHGGARPSHAVWQGKVYSRSGTSAKYPGLVEATGYGTGPGLMGWNCRHSIYPFFPGISKEIYDEKTAEGLRKRVTFNGKEMDLYSATQKQREIERKIRRWKRQTRALEAAGLTNVDEFRRMRMAQAEMRSFIKQTGLMRQREREGSAVRKFIAELSR